MSRRWFWFCYFFRAFVFLCFYFVLITIVGKMLWLTTFLKTRECARQEALSNTFARVWTLEDDTSVSHFNTDVLVHVLGGSVAVMFPMWTVVVPVIPRGALPVHHLQWLEVSEQGGGGGWRERFRGWLEEGYMTASTGDKGWNGDINRKTIRWQRKTTSIRQRGSLKHQQGR